MDVLTLTIVNMFIAGAATTLLLFLYMADTQQRHLLYWALAASCMAGSSILGALFHLGQALPYWVLPSLSNSLTLGIHLAMLAGLYQYFQRPVQVSWFVIAALAIFSIHFSDFAQHTTANRLLLNFPLIIFLNALSLHLLLHHRNSALRSVYLAFSLAFVFNIIQLSSRFMLVLTEQLELTSLSSNKLNHSLGFFGLTTFALLAFGSCILLVYRQQQLALQHRSERDALTGVLNRHSMAQKITAELDRSQRLSSQCSLVIFDIDHFKHVNDLHGHVAGDAALRHIAKIATAQLRSYDLLFRYGGEEFVVCLPDSNLHTAKHIASRIRKAIESSVLVNYPKVSLTISAGIASSSGQMTWHDMLLQADRALYFAKDNGRNQICHFNGLDPQTI